MTTVAQMIEWMKTLPQDAEVECGVEEIFSGYERYMVHRPVDIECCDVFDYTGEEYDKYPHVSGKIIIKLIGK